MSLYSQFKPSYGVSSINAGTGTYVSTSTGAVTIGNAGVVSLSSGTDTVINTSTGIVQVDVTSTLQSVTSRGSTTTYAITINNNSASTSSNTGALTVAGGVGISGSLYAGTMFSNGSLVLTTSSINQNQIVTTITPGTDISVNTTTGNVTVSDSSTLQSVTSRGSTTNNSITVTNTSSSTSTNTGALQVYGGVGIGGNINVSGIATVNSTLNASDRILVNPQLIVSSDPLDSLNSSTVVIESSVPIGYSAFTIRNNGLLGRSYTFEVGGNNHNYTNGPGLNEGNLTVYDDVDGVYRLVIRKNGNVVLGNTNDDGNRLQVNGSISATTATFSSSVSATVGTFSDAISATTATFSGDLSATTATFSGSIIFNNALQEMRATLVNTTDTTEVDSFVAENYRSCKCFVQVEDELNGNFQITEIVLLHDNDGQVYKSEYGIISTGGEKGIFTADLQIDGVVRLYFTASEASAKTVKIVKTALPK